MALCFKLDIGTHSIDLWPDGETLRPHFTWHKTVPILQWTCQELIRWAIDAENDADYVAAERAFIEAYAPGQAKQL